MKAIKFTNNKMLNRVEVFKNPFRLNIFLHEKYAGRINDGTYPADYLINREKITSIASRLNDKYHIANGIPLITIHENHYDPEKVGKVPNKKDLALYHPTDNQRTKDGKFLYHIHIDFLIAT